MFREDIERTMGRVLKAEKYRMIILDGSCVYFIKRYSDELAFYIRCMDSRDRNHGVSVEMFFSPIETPADNILSLKTGIHIRILTEYEDITDDIMISAGKKVAAIEKNIGSLSNVILEELNEPYFPSRRISFYKKGVTVYRTVEEDTALREEFERLIKNEKRMIRSKKTKQAYQLGHEFIGQLPEDYLRSKGIDLELSDSNKREFAIHVYAQCALDADF